MMVIDDYLEDVAELPGYDAPPQPVLPETAAAYQARERRFMDAIRAAIALLDGRQLIDIPGAVMVLQLALDTNARAALDAAPGAGA